MGITEYFTDPPPWKYRILAATIYIMCLMTVYYIDVRYIRG